MKHLHFTTYLLLIFSLAACQGIDPDTGHLDSGSSDTETPKIFPEPQLSSCSDMDKANYEVSFQSNWNGRTFPTNYPSGAHFSRLIGATHSAAVNLWRIGSIASAGIESMAEFGGTSDLKSEIDALGDSDRGSTLGPSSASSSITFSIDKRTPLVSLVTMIAPSSDWFTGVGSHNLLNANNQWLSMSIDVLAYDAGTEEDDKVFSFSNKASSPYQPISTLSNNETNFDQGKHRDNGIYIGVFTFSLQCTES